MLPLFHWVLLGGRAGNPRDLDLKLWIWERRDAGWACGVGRGSVTTTVMTTLGVPPGLSSFIAHIFFY